MEKLKDEKYDYCLKMEDENNLKKRTKEFKALLEKNQVLEEFDRGVFESIIEKIIVGEIDENGNKNPYKLTFVYKTGISNKVTPKKAWETKIGKELKFNFQKLSSYVKNGVNEMCSHLVAGTCGVRDGTTSEG